MVRSARGAAEAATHDSDADAPHYAADERLQHEVGEPMGRILPLVCLLQFLPDSPDVKGDACDGSGDHKSGVEFG